MPSAPFSANKSPGPPPSLHNPLSVRGAEGFLRPWQRGKSIARGAGDLLRPWQQGKVIAGGTGDLVRPWQWGKGFARGTGDLLRPWQRRKGIARGAGGFLRPWQQGKVIARGTGRAGRNESWARRRRRKHLVQQTLRIGAKRQRGAWGNLPPDRGGAGSAWRDGA